MAAHPVEATPALEAAMRSERARLVGLCVHLTGDRDAAEDLAQETLLEAWRHGHKLRDPQGVSPWLSAVARNVCLRWARGRGRELARIAPPSRDADGTPLDVGEATSDGYDLEVELDRGELAALLDRALALLPPETRDVLVRHYVEESPHAETAARLGLSEGAVKLRLFRGRLALRRLLATELREEAAAFGLDADVAGGWEATRIWCAICGRDRLVGRWDRAAGELTLRCPTCIPGYRREPSANMAYGSDPEVFRGVRGYKPAFTRLMNQAQALYAPAFARGETACLGCGAPTPVRIGLSPLTAGLADRLPGGLWSDTGAYFLCAACGWDSDICLAGLALWTPEGRRFWREHPRLRLLPERDVEAEGEAAVVTTYEAVGSGARLAVVSARRDCRVLGVFGAPGVEREP